MCKCKKPPESYLAGGFVYLCFSLLFPKWNFGKTGYLLMSVAVG